MTIGIYEKLASEKVRHYMEYWTRFKCILTRNIFFIVELLDYCYYFGVFKYGLLYSKNNFKH